MAESLKKNYSKRVIFSPGRQQRFLLKAIENLNLSWALFADKLAVHTRTLNDWKREEYSMPLNIVKKISRIAKVEIPKDIKTKEPFWYVNKGAKIGGIACFKKYGRVGGDPEYRKKKWYEWWEKKGKFINRDIFKRKPIKKPRKDTDLAEFIGIMLGDGGIASKSKQVQITLNNKDDKEYIKFICEIIKKLFNRVPSISKYSNCLASKIVISSMDLIDYLIELGLKRGNKIEQQVNIPDWIKQNKLYSIACIRGLVDTDGCIFNHSYRVNGKVYNYKKLSFTSYSKPLRYSVFKIMKDNGLNPRLAQGRDVRLDSIKDMRRYFQIFNSHNPKHLKRLKN